MADKKQRGEQIKNFSKGLHTDNSYLNQPPNTYTFALNAVNVTDKGDEGWRANEESNEQCYELTTGYIPLGKVNISEGEQVIFSTSPDESSSEIGIIDVNCGYRVVVNGDLGFKIGNQISATYRLRRGCERTLYFVTPTPMIFNLDAPEDFKTGGVLDINKFKLSKVYEVIPTFDSIRVLENGALLPGSYNASIQYLDNDLNPTEWITTTEPIKIYNNNTSKKYENIRGSMDQEGTVVSFGITNKSIEFSFGAFDPSYLFYRIAIISANAGTGQVTKVTYSSPISTDVKTYTYSGLSSAVTEGTEDEILAFNNIIEEADYVEQIENRLILSKTKGVQINYCNLQRYASKIKADLTLKSILLNTIGESNPKTATVNFDGTGYMPGEIYSFGIVYIFDDSSLSPVYHIPGRASAYVSDMSLDNTTTDTFYTPNGSCKDFWGVDSEGVVLENTLKRHHRFPLRSEINEPLYTKVKSTEVLNLNYLQLFTDGTLLEIEDPESPPATIPITTISYTVNYTIDGTAYTYSSGITAASYDPIVGITSDINSSRGVIIVGDVYEGVDGGAEVNIGNASAGVTSATTGVTYAPSINVRALESDVSLYSANIMTITFSGIESPSIESTNGHQIIGYYIVRNERDEDSRTILDTGVIVPTMDTDRGFVAHGHIFPNLTLPTTLKKDVFALIHPEHKFNNKEYKNTATLKQEGTYTIDSQSKSSVLTQDVGVGSSYDPAIHKKSSNDYDGYSLHTLTRDTEVAFSEVDGVFMNDLNKEEIFYLNALNSLAITDTLGDRKEVYNVSGDNKIGIVQLNTDIVDINTVHNQLPYVVMQRELANPYGNFSVLPYYKDSKEPVYFTDDVDPLINGDTENVQNGDSYITPMRYHSALFYNARIADRNKKSSTWKIILGAILVAVGVVGAIFSAGTSTTISVLGLSLIAGASVAAVGLGVSVVASGLESAQVIKVYNEIYEAGLRDTIIDIDTDLVFGEDGSSTPTITDDEYQWLSDTVTNLWFESSVNMGLRHGVNYNITDFLDSPATKAEPGVYVTNVGTWGEPTFDESAVSPVNILDNYILEKLTTIDADNEDGRLYKGYAGAETYFLNPDYVRTNKQKVFYALGLEYDCCSDCNEDFPHRNWYSEQSFQEELTDNFRVFLPNNYRDIEGEKGVITDVFRLKNNLFIQTEEALWHLPQDIQERVTGDIVSFIGTGGFFSVPPRLIEDSDYPSAGTTHNWARLKTSSGILFVSEKDRKIYMFNGQQVAPITMAGNNMWFKNNMELQADADFKKTSLLSYPLANNPSNKFGTGYISAYDTTKERLIVTKKDFIFSQSVIGLTDYNVTSYNNEFIIFKNYQATIDSMAYYGWEYQGIVQDKMKFIRVTAGITTVQNISGTIEPDPIEYDNSWTMSYSLKDRAWIGWHSFTPNFYIGRNEKFYSWKNDNDFIWKHNRVNHFQTYYGVYYPHILEYVDNYDPLQTKIWDWITIQSEAKGYVAEYETLVDKKDITFNKFLAYNTYQATGVINLEVKNDGAEYLFEQVINEANTILIDRNERNWTFNDIRDVRVNYELPIFRKDKSSLSSEYYIDKILNDSSIDFNKDWTQLQSFRDKYLVLRLIFDNFDNIRLITNFTKENETNSFR